MSKKLITALLALDASNDEHWTQDGLPRLDILKEAVGESVSRGDIANVAKSFNRFNTVIGNEEALAETNAQTSFEKEIKPGSPFEGTVVADSIATQKTELNEDLDLDLDLDVELQIAEAKLESSDPELTGKELALANLKKASLAFDKAKSVFQEARKAVDAIRTKEVEIQKAIPAHESVKAYQRSQADQRAKNVKNVNAMRDIAKTLSREDAQALNSSLSSML